jgi:hypothetical protein
LKIQSASIAERGGGATLVQSIRRRKGFPYAGYLPNWAADHGQAKETPMAKKPPFRIVPDPGSTESEAATSAPHPSRPLGEHGQKLWDQITAEFEIDDSPGREVLTSACAMVDRAEQLAECISRDGPVVRGPNGVRSHPAIREELSCRSFTVRALRQLGVTLEPLRSGPGRPPGS